MLKSWTEQNKLSASAACCFHTLQRHVGLAHINNSITQIPCHFLNDPQHLRMVPIGGEREWGPMGCRVPVIPLGGCLATEVGSGQGAQGASRTFRWLPISSCGMGQQLAAIEGGRGPGSQGGVHAVLCPQQLHLNA